MLADNQSNGREPMASDSWKMAHNPGAMDFMILFGMESGPLTFDVLKEFRHTGDVNRDVGEWVSNGFVFDICKIFICTIFSEDWLEFSQQYVDLLLTVTMKGTFVFKGRDPDVVLFSGFDVATEWFGIVVL